VLVGARDLDPTEVEHVQAGRIELVEVGPDLRERLASVIAGRPVYFHLDCDVLEPGLVRTDYQVPHGLSLEDLHDCAEVVGVEVGEFEGEGRATADDLVAALGPLFSS
jgi:arginase family enzyme